MKKIFLCLIFAIAVPLQAATYFVDPVNGSDANNGLSLEEAFKTLDKCIDIGTDLDIFKLQTGDYGAFDTPGTKPDNSDWITYIANTDQEPNFAYIDVGPGVGGDSYFQFENINIGPGRPDRNYRGTNFINTDFVRLYKCHIFGPPTNTASNAFPFMGNDQTSGVYLTNTRFVEVNDCNLQDYKHGIFAIDNNRDGSVETSDVNVTDCNITRCTFGITQWGNNWRIQDCNIYRTYSDGIIVRGRSSTIHGNTIHDINSPIVYTDSTGFSYVDATQTITADSGTPFATWDGEYVDQVIITVDGNQISNASDWLVSSFTGNTIVIADNVGTNYPTITKVETNANAHIDAIQFQNASGSYDPNNITITNNIMYNMGYATWSDAQAIWVGNGKNSPPGYNDNVFENNLIYDVFGNGRGIGFHGTQTGIIFRNNTVPNERVEFIWDAQCDILTGNVVWKIDFQQEKVSPAGEDYDPKTPCPTLRSHNVVNNWWVHIDDVNCPPNATSFEIDNQTTWEAQFVDYDAKDFQLANDACAVDIDAPNAPEFDLLGVPRDGAADAGCYENTNLVVPSPGPPTPNPATWATPPAADGDNAISMVATTATDDDTPLSYYFQETTGNPGGFDSGWQVSDATYTDSGLDGNTIYSYKVQYRDAVLETGEWSTPVSSATAADTTIPTPNPASFSVVPVVVSDTSITMTATTGVDAGPTIQYFFNETTGNDGGTDSGWQSSSTYIDTGLSVNTTYTYTVQMRDSVPNTGTASGGSSATTTSFAGTSVAVARRMDRFVIEKRTRGNYVYASAMLFIAIIGYELTGKFERKRKC